jgi:phosphate transport system substrate-binding protein
MKIPAVLKGCLPALALLGLLGTWQAQAAELLRLTGTGSAIGGMQLLADAFAKQQRDVRIEVQTAIGSSGGITALMAGRIELAVSNRPPSADERKQGGLLDLDYARTPFVLAVQPNLGLKDISFAQVAAIYAEPGASYPDGTRARPVLRPSDPGDMDRLRAFSPEIARAVDLAMQRRGMLTASTDSEAADLAERTPGALALSTLSLIESEKRDLIALSLNGQPATVAALMDGRYPYFKSLYLIYSRDASEGTRRFIAFVQSAPAKALLRAHGHAPR